MDWLTFGFWDAVDQTLCWIGRCATSFLRKPNQDAENIAYAVIGGALVCTVFGGVIGFALSNFSRSIVTIDGAILGGLLGACSGIFFGSFVDTVDGTIKDFLRSLSSNSK